MRKLILCIISISIAVTSFAQTRTITGKVTDEKGDALPDVSVTVKGARGGTTTRNDGLYSITVEPAAKTLIFSSVGFAAQERSLLATMLPLT